MMYELYEQAVNLRIALENATAAERVDPGHLADALFDITGLVADVLRVLRFYEE
jgi:hypothetical protein